MRATLYKNRAPQPHQKQAPSKRPVAPEVRKSLQVIKAVHENSSEP